MFNSIRGTVTAKLADGVRLETGGVEWDLAAPATDVERLPGVGEQARVYTWLLHREDQMRLFGFASEARRGVFLELLKVEGVGPKGALKILGGIGEEALARALEEGDVERLEAVPGLGKKTAQKMILALKGRLLVRRETEAAVSTPYGDLVEALAGMGYDRRLAAQAVTAAAKGLPAGLAGADREQWLFRQAIVRLSGPAGAG